MLTTDLVRVSLRSGKVKPRFVDARAPALLEDAHRLIELYGRHVGRTVGELEDALADLIGDSPDFGRARGLAKLLRDRATIEMRSPLEGVTPSEVRARVFAAAAEGGPVGPVDPRSGEPAPGLRDRGEVLDEVAAAFGTDRATLEATLFADRKNEERLVAIDLPTAEALLDRYNLALAQGVLLRARAVRITLPGVEAKRARQLLRMIKFHRLMHRAERTGEGWVVTLDGPLSLFRQTQRYGLQLALLLPTLCHAERWALEADVTWGEPKRECVFELSDAQGLTSHTKDLGTWRSDEERHFEATFKKAVAPKGKRKGAKGKGKADASKAEPTWRLRRTARLVDLDGRGVLVPDYTLQHADGRVALLEIVWFWRKQAFKDRLALLAEAGPPNLIVAVATRLNADEKGEGKHALNGLDPERVYPFKGVIQPKRILELADAVAV